VFTVDTQEAGSGEVLVYVEDPEGYKEEVITLDDGHIIYTRKQPPLLKL